MYHSPLGCTRGDNCDFIHDPNYKGVATPNMEKYVRPLERLSRNAETNAKNIAKFGKSLPPAEAAHPANFSYSHFSAAPGESLNNLNNIRAFSEAGGASFPLIGDKRAGFSAEQQHSYSAGDPDKRVKFL